MLNWAQILKNIFLKWLLRNWYRGNRCPAPPRHLVYRSAPPALISVFNEQAGYAIHHLQTKEAIWNQYFSGDESEAKTSRYVKVALSFSFESYHGLDEPPERRR